MVRELNAIFSGVVQGVLFRATVKKHADHLGLVGTVKNLDDGSVELVLHGSEKEIEIFLDNLKKSPGSARIHSIEHHISEPKKKYKSFNIIY